MMWECRECGCRIRGQLEPTHCPECGIVGPIFNKADSDESWEPGGGSLREYWLECGMNEMQGPAFAPIMVRKKNP